MFPRYKYVETYISVIYSAGKKRRKRPESAGAVVSGLKGLDKAFGSCIAAPNLMNRIRIQ